jgi:hypothetical protein
MSAVDPICIQRLCAQAQSLFYGQAAHGFDLFFRCGLLDGHLISH